MKKEVKIVKQNLGKLDRWFRFLLGAWLVSFVLPKVQLAWLWWVLLIIAVWSLAESFTAYCCGHKWFKINNKNQ